MEGIDDDKIWMRKYVMTGAAAVVALAFVRVLMRVRRSDKKLRLPPGPKGYPVLGSFLILAKTPGNTPHEALHRLSLKYGPLMYLRLGSVPTLIASSAELAKEILKTADATFASRRATIQGEHLFYKRQDLICSPFGENTLFLRKICTTELFSHKRVQQFKHIREEEVLAGIKWILKDGRGGGPLDLTRRLSELTLNNTTRLLFGKKFYGTGVDAVQSEKFLGFMEEFFVRGLFGFSDFFPFLRAIDLDGFEKSMRNLRVQVDNFLDPIIQERRERASSGQTTDTADFLDVLLQLQGESGNSGRVLTDEGAKGLLWDLLLGGTDTSSHVLIWIVSVLMRYPEVRKKVQAEVESVVGTERMVEEADIANMPYLQAVIKETMRLYPVSPLTIPRKPVRATKLAGYDIPEDCLVLVNSYSIQRDPNLWTDALKFDPDRFLDGSVDHKGLHFQFLPFGSGRRMCVGMPLGMLMVELTFAQLIHACELSLPEGMKPEDVDLSSEYRSVIGPAHPAKVLVSPRLPAKVYSEAGIEF